MVARPLDCDSARPKLAVRTSGLVGCTKAARKPRSAAALNRSASTRTVGAIQRRHNLKMTHALSARPAIPAIPKSKDPADARRSRVPRSVDATHRATQWSGPLSHPMPTSAVQRAHTRPALTAPMTGRRQLLPVASITSGDDCMRIYQAPRPLKTAKGVRMRIQRSKPSVTWPA